MISITMSQRDMMSIRETVSITMSTTIIMEWHTLMNMKEKSPFMMHPTETEREKIRVDAVEVAELLSGISTSQK
jgi:hypothetical protein